MHTYVGLRGVGVGVGAGALLLVLLIAPLVLGAVIAAGAALAFSAALGAGGGHLLGRHAATLLAAGKLVALAIPLGLLVAFFGHESPTSVAAGLYSAHGAIPASIALIVAGIYAEG